MLTIDDIRSQYPGAKDLSDAEVLSRISKVTQLPLEQVAQDFGIADPRKAPKGAIGGLNDFMINTANAAVGGVKSAIDFVSPGSSVSGSLDEFIKSGEQKLSLQERLSQERLSQGLDTSDIGTQAGAVLKRVTEAPFQVAGQAIGSFAIPGTTIKGARGVAGALGVGERAALRAAEVGPITPRMAQGAASQALDRVGTGAGMLTGAAMAGGDAAGEAYDRVLEKTGDRALATQAAREASIVPAMIGGASSLFGADRAIARGGSKSILRTTAGEFGGEFIEEGATKLSANLATSQYVPNTNVMAGVFGSGLLGGIQGLGTGLAVGLATKQHSILGDANQPTGDAGLKTDGSGIGKAININDAETTQKSAIPPNGVINVTAGGTALVTPEQQKAYDQYGRNQMGPFQPPPAPPAANTPNAQAQSGQAAAANAQNNQQKQQQATQQQFTELASVYGITGGQPGQPFKLAGKNLFVQSDAETFLRSIDKLNEGKTLEQKKAMGAVLAANAIKVKPNATAQQVVGAVNKFLDGWSLSSATSQEDFIARLEANIQTVEGSKALDQAEALNNIYRHITGQDSPAFVALQKAAEVENQPKEKTKKAAPSLPAAQQPSAPTSANATAIAEAQARLDAENAAQTTTGAVNEQPILQNNAGIRKVSVQGGAAESSQGGTGVIQSQSIQPVGAGSVAGGQNSLENDTSGTGGARSSTNELPTTNTNVPDRELTEAEAQIKELVVAAFGKRDANIIYDVLVNDLSGPKIAKKYGISQQRVDQIAGPKAQKGWSKRIEKAAGRLGMTIDEVEALFEPHKNNTSEANKEKENQLSAATTSQADAIAEAQARLDAELASQGDQPPTNEDDTKPEKEKEVQPVDIESTTRKLSDEFDKDAAYGRGFGDDLSGDREKAPKYGAGIRIFQIGQSGEVGLEDASSSNRSYAKFKKSGAAKLEEYEVNNILAEVEDLTDDEVTSLIDRARELETRRIAKAEEERNKGKENAVQESSTEEVPVRQRAGRGKAVAEGNTKGSKAAPEGKAKTKTEVKETPRNQVGKDPDSYINTNAQIARDQSDRMGLTDKIEAAFARGLTAKQVTSELKNELAVLPAEERGTFVVQVRATLGIPSQESKAEFKTWQDKYNNRQVKAPVAPVGFRYSIVESPAYDSVDPLSQEDADFELSVLLERAKRGKLTPEAFAQSEIAKRLDTAQVMTVNEGLKTDQVATVEALIKALQPTSKAETKTEVKIEEEKEAAQAKIDADNKKNKAEYNRRKEIIEQFEKDNDNAYLSDEVIDHENASDDGYGKTEDNEGYWTSMLASQESALIGRADDLKLDINPLWKALKPVKAPAAKKTPAKETPTEETPKTEKEQLQTLLKYDESRLKALPKTKANNGERFTLELSIRDIKEKLAAMEQAEEAKTPEQRWTEAVAPFDGAPWDSLSKNQQDRVTDLVQRKQFNLAAANTIVDEEPQYSRSEEPVTQTLSEQALRDELNEFMGTDTSAKIEIITDEADLPKSVKDSKDFKSGFQAVVADGVVYMNAPKISKGTGRAVLMHELGVHLGLQKLLSGQDQAALIAQIKSWSKLTNGSLESQIAQAAMSRVDVAGTTDAQRNTELLAYFVEEAVLSGINPAATTATKSVFEKFVRRIYAAFKSAIHRLRLKSDNLSAQDVVDLAYGAARLSLTGSFHGTGAKFRKFNHQYMSSGEGLQAYGWGSYFAQKFGIANSYRATESKKKRVSEIVKVLEENIGARVAVEIIDPGTQDPIIYAGDKLTRDNIPSIAATISKVGIDEIKLTQTDPKSGAETTGWVKLPDGPYGNIHMVDFAIANDEWLDYDAMIVEQPQKIQELIKAISKDISLSPPLSIDTGQTYYDNLKELFKIGERSSLFSSPEFDAAIKKRQYDKAVSLYLDHMGIKGIKFLDQPSRNTKFVYNRISRYRDDVKDAQNLVQEAKKNLARHNATAPRGIEATNPDMRARWQAAQDRQRVYIEGDLKRAEDYLVERRQKLDKYVAENATELKQVTRNSVVFNDKNILRVSTKTAQSNYNKLQYSFAGTVALKRSGNPDNMANFVAAKLMESQGESAENIWENTGWYHGADGKWRFEIDDSKAKFTFPATPKPGTAARQAFANASYTLKDFLDHPDLYNVYPELRNIPVEWRPFGDDEEAALVFDFLPNSLKVSNIELNGSSIQTEKSLIHEVQHAIQVIEKFNGGSNVSVFDALNYSLDKNGNISRITLAQVGKLREIVKNPDFLADQYFSDAQRNKVDNALQGLELAIKHKASNKIINDIQKNFPSDVETILAYISYRLVAGEVEANNTANRLNLGEMGRSLLFPGETTGGISKDAEILTKERAPKTLRTSIDSTRQLAEDKISKLPKPYQGPLNTIADTLANIARKGITGLAFTKDLAGMAAQRGLTSALNYVNLMGQRQAIKTENERKVEKIIQAFDKLDSNLKGTGPGSVNAFLKESTLSGKWGFDPSWISGVKVDKDLADKFDALPVQAQNVVKSVFRHGFDTLAAMKKGVMDNINSEYDALIADAQARGDAKDTAELQKKKIESLQNYQSMMAVNAKSPYTPLKRFGNYVVVGRSAEYLDAETAAEDTSSTPEERAEARKQLRKYETDEKHYFVQFAETDAEAKAIARDTQRTYPGGLVQNFQKDQVRDKLYGGRDIQGVFYRLRNLINDSQEEKGIAEASKKSLNRLVNDLHLSLLSEHSARQSERQRKGIAGADEDMMRAFVTQGRATAHFISTLHNTGQIYDSLRDMKKEANARTDGRDVRSQYYNEMLKRHAMTLDYQVSPVIDKAMSVTSTWMLLTSPAYYLQNMTQPFMMSLPVLAAKHGYAKSASAMTTAYRELTSVLSKNGLGEETYGKLPSDVRAAIESLVNSGHIDISLSQDLGRWRSSGDQNAAAKVLDKIKSISEDVEAINRVVTAVAAYRLEKNTGASQNKAVEYAGKVVYDTHGDYSGFNAPRVSRQGFGRLATQFRKFQLIQISLIAKLSSQAFGNASPEDTSSTPEERAKERAIGKKALAYTLTHTFAVGGLMGMPGFAAIAWIIGKAFGDHDEPDNPEATLRKMIGDDAMADLLLKGIPKLAGVDLSGKLGMGQMLSLLPYTDIELSRDGYAKVVTAAMGPFIGGIMPKVVDGVAQMANGEYYKGIETMAPTGLGQAMKGYRAGTEGLTKRNGEVILSPDEITFFDAFMQGIGLPTNTITDREFINRTEIKYEQFYNDRTSDIKRDYISAYKSGNSEAMEEARQDWRDMQDSRRKNGFKIQPMSDLFKAPQAAMKREVKTNRTLNTSGATSAGFQLR